MRRPFSGTQGPRGSGCGLDMCRALLGFTYPQPQVAYHTAWPVAQWLHNPCHLGGPQQQCGDKIRSGYLTTTISGAHVILGTENKCTICEGERPKKENVLIKIGEKVVYGGIRFVKSVCMYAPLFRLYSRIITQTVRHKAHCRHRKISIPLGVFGGRRCASGARRVATLNDRA